MLNEFGRLVAVASGSIPSMRRMIKVTDGNNEVDIAKTLDSLQEFLAISRGSLLTMTDRLGYGDELNEFKEQGQDRIDAASACKGLSGRA
ncbi:hypothetical protein [Mameliella alba]|uniref:hypothetical protein n=1 Tax=Mameliella alba TaxID=561184 RepID=UPI0014309610|nr:hypothetical protein [Mameliella alba]